MDASTGLWALFTSSFLAATLLPGGSELVLYGVLQLHPETRWTAIAVATLGNTLGALTSYGLGRLIPRVKAQAADDASRGSASRKGITLLQRYGSPVLLLSWVPFVGDPLCLAAGWLRINAALATLFIAAGKLARYVVVAAIAI